MFCFHGENANPTIQYLDENGKDYQNGRIKGYMSVRYCNFTEESPVLRAIVKELKSPRRIKIERRRGRHDEEEEDAVTCRHWGNITIRNCKGRIDLLMKEISSSSIDQLCLVMESMRRVDNASHNCAWIGLSHFLHSRRLPFPRWNS